MGRRKARPSNLLVLLYCKNIEKQYVLLMMLRSWTDLADDLVLHNPYCDVLESGKIFMAVVIPLPSYMLNPTSLRIVHIPFIF